MTIAKPLIPIFFASLTGLALPAQSALGQSMNYGSLEQLFGEAVTTSATGLPQRVAEAPVDMIVVTAEDIRRSGAHDIPGVLSHVSGVDVLQWNAANADVAIRGYNQAFSARTLVLIDGRQVYADYYGFIPWNALPVEMSAIRQIEIVKGPNAALFGFNAVGGVINIITFNPRYDVVEALDVTVGTQGLTDLSAVGTLSFGQYGGLRLSGGYRSGGNFATTVPASMIMQTPVGHNRAMVNLNAVVAPVSGVEIGIEASNAHVKQSEVAPSYGMQNSWYDINSLKVQLLADGSYGLVKINAYSNWLHWHGTTMPIFGDFRLSNQVTVVQIEDAITLGSEHALRLAAEYRHNTANTTPLSGGEVFYDVYSGSAMWHWRMAPELNLTGALRLDHLELSRTGITPPDYPFTNADWNRGITEFSYNIGLVWQPSDGDSVRLIAGRGVQLPSLVQAGALLVHSPYGQMSGNPDLKVSVITNIEAMWNRKLMDGLAEMQAAVFFQKSKNMLSLSGIDIPIPGGVVSTPSNIGDSQSYGVEMNLKGAMFDRGRWSIAYRGMIVNDYFLPSAAGPYNLLNYEDTTPRNLVKGCLGWEFDWGGADLFLRYQSPMLGLRQVGIGATETVHIGGYAAIDASLTWLLNDWASLRLSGRNLLQERQRQTSGPLAERRLEVSLQLKG